MGLGMIHSGGYSKEPKKPISGSIGGFSKGTPHQPSPSGGFVFSKSYDASSAEKTFRLGDPRPYKFETLMESRFGDVVVVKVRFPECKNYEGVKVLVYDTYKKFKKAIEQKWLDPHFLEDSNGPIARFEPTDKGWK